MKSITVNDFQLGWQRDRTLEQNSGFPYASGCDILNDPGILRVSYKAVEETGFSDDSPSASIVSFAQFSNDGKIYGKDLGSGIWKRTSATDYALDHTDGNGGGGSDIVEYAGNLYWASSAAVGRNVAGVYTDTWNAITNSGTASERILITFQDKLLIGHGRYVSSYNGVTFTNEDLTLPPDVRVTSMRDFGNYVAIGTREQASSTIDKPNARIFFWDGLASTTYADIVNVEEQGIDALAVKGNVLYAAIGGVGFCNIYVYDGARLVPYKKFAFIDENKVFTVQRNTFIPYHDWLLVGGGYLDTEMPQAIYAVGANDVGIYRPISVSMPFISSQGLLTASFTGIDSLYSFGSAILMGYRSASGTERVDIIDVGNRIASTAQYYTQIHACGDVSSKKQFWGIKFDCENMPSGTSFTVDYRVDPANFDATWTTGLATVTSSNMNSLFRLPQKSGRTIQFRLTFTTNGTATPVLRGYTLYFSQRRANVA